jgi:2-C-methyl-D-erythritol 4-phosphate cytidylyltransferase
MSTHAIIVSAGKGVRMNRSIPKQYLPLKGRPVLCHTISAFSRCPEIDKIVVVVAENDISYCREELLPGLGIDTSTHVLAGGKRRQDSVYRGIQSIDDTRGIVVIHDGVRPLIEPKMISQCVRKAEVTGACILGMPLHDTLKSVVNGRQIQKTINREGIWLAQTPQAFQYRLIRDAHEAAARDHIEATDDASLLERMGTPVHILKGSKNNLKITTEEDLILADALLS